MDCILERIDTYDNRFRVLQFMSCHVCVSVSYIVSMLVYAFHRLQIQIYGNRLTVNIYSIKKKSKIMNMYKYKIDNKSDFILTQLLVSKHSYIIQEEGTQVNSHQMSLSYIIHHYQSSIGQSRANKKSTFEGS